MQGKALKERLTGRDLIWLGYLVRGYSTKQIAEEMKLAEYSIDQNIYHTMLRMGVTKRTQAVALAMKYKLVSV